MLSIGILIVPFEIAGYLKITVPFPLALKNVTHLTITTTTYYYIVVISITEYLN